MKTKYSEKMDKSCPHAYYPRPQFKRDSYICLNGEWDFAVTDDGGEVKDYGEKILVPFPPESELSGISRRIRENEYMHYRRVFSVDSEFVRDRVLLHFGAVDQKCKVYLNGKRVGKHKGGYLPFSIDITDSLTIGENTLEVTARDRLDHKYPWGKQKNDRGGMWYTPVSGIWQTVWLESLPPNAISAIKIEPLLDGVALIVRGGEDKKLLTLTDSGEKIEFTGDKVTVRPSDLRLWTPDEPYLYRFILDSGEDRIESYFAVRTVDVREINGINRICLNGEPYLFNGLLDQGYFPDGIYMPATVDGYVDDIRLTKELGFNMLRKHIKIEPEIFYYLCDSMGIAVFQDMVNNGDYSFLRDTALPTVGIQRIGDRRLNRDEDTREIFLNSMEETAELLYNHPSVVYYTIFNEGWGQFEADRAYEILKALDGTRIIDSTSGWFRQTKSDVDSRHIYFRPLKQKLRGGEPLVISEFGGYSHRVEGHTFGCDNYGYRSFGERGKFEDAICRLYEEEVRPLVKQGASAFVYTQLSDVEDETNGFVTYDREVCKVDTARIRSVMEGLEQER